MFLPRVYCKRSALKLPVARAYLRQRSAAVNEKVLRRQPTSHAANWCHTALGPMTNTRTLLMRKSATAAHSETG